MKLKKVFLLPLLGITFTSLTGCNTDTRTQISYGTYIHTKAVEIKSYEDLVLKLNRGENMIVATYLSGFSETCGCWQTFSINLDNYVSEYDTMIYKIDRNLIEGKSETYGITFVKASDPSLLVFSNGELKNQFLDNSANAEMFDSKDALRQTLQKVTKDPKVYFVNEKYLENNLASKDEVIIHYIRNSCADCNYCFPNVIQPYINENEITTSFWIIDLDVPGLYLNEEGTAKAEDLTAYQNFKDKYFLSYEKNETFGFGSGVVPTTQYWQNGELKDMSVYFNDTIALNANNQWEIVDSYYTSERVNNLGYTDTVIKGKILNNDEVIASYDENNKPLYAIWSQPKAAAVHNEILKQFFDKYAK